MKIGIGIDTGGTCTDAVIYDFEGGAITAFSKTPTTKEELSIGIGKALDGLPSDLVHRAEVIALSTTLATNACVENKGGRAKLIFFGVNPANVERAGGEYGLPGDDSLIFIDSHTTPGGEITRYPDWEEFKAKIRERLSGCDAAAVVEMYAKKSGAQLEKKASELIKAELDIPVVCGYTLFSESNIIKRGASALLNARLIFVIDGFLKAVRRALEQRGIKAPFVIVRSDGSLMTGDFTVNRPVETLLCGPVASVMGAAKLTNEKNCVVVDIGGTTTDIAFVKDGSPQRVKSGVRIGKWNTFVKGLFVDTFGLGGDSGVAVSPSGELQLEDTKVMPLCMAAALHPSLMKLLRREYERGGRLVSQQKDIYVRLKDISGGSYTKKERDIAALLSEPHSLEELKDSYGEMVLQSHLARLLAEGVLIRCGVTPTDAMHLKGDFAQYDSAAAACGLGTMARTLGVTAEALAERIYDEFRRKLYRNILRILIEDAYPEIRESGMGVQLDIITNDAYDRAKSGEDREFLGLRFSTPAVLAGVGAPTKLFLGDVGRLLGARVVLSEYSPVANALGAVIGNVSASVPMEVVFQQDSDDYALFGCGQRIIFQSLEEAKARADEIAREKAREEAIARGAEPEGLSVTASADENIVETNFGFVYMGYKVTATASGRLRLTSNQL